jgi:DNA-binding transcriptional LysR family regulator
LNINGSLRQRIYFQAIHSISESIEGVSVSISIKQLEALHWVAQLGGFQSAASHLNTSQSTITKRVAELESLLGVALFDRSKRRARLTPVGRKILAHATSMVELQSRLVGDARGAETYDGIIRLAATELIGMTWLPRFIAAVRRDHPRLYIELDVDHGGRLLTRLNQDMYDLALIPGPMWGRAFRSVSLGVLDRCWMASPSLGLGKKPFTIQELSELPVVTQFPETVHAQMQASWLRNHGFLPRRVVHANSYVVMGRLVEAGLGVGLMAERYYQRELRSRRLVRVKTVAKVPDVEYFAVYRRTQQLPAIAEIAQLAQTVCDFGLRSPA